MYYAPFTMLRYISDFPAMNWVVQTDCPFLLQIFLQWTRHYQLYSTNSALWTSNFLTPTLKLVRTPLNNLLRGF